ncbi:metallophosphoesterase family protein [Pseudoalteromonas sp. S1727]|uniref:metallophosphoesterase family protein n=1 Tax=Pseudoalteromonas sp. S1727 TaxID=2066514 RepID=UPI0020164D6B|nr:metallophosphoesterase family protein [Pseudoalteromonas sp. S1727]
MKLHKFTLTLAAAAVLSACSFDDNKDEINSLEQQVAQLEASLAAVNAENSLSDEQVSDMLSQINSLTAQLDGLTNLPDEEVEALKSELNLLATQLSESNELTQLESELIQKNIADLTLKLNNSITASDEDVTALKEEIAALTDQLSSLTTDSGADIDALQAKIDSLTTIIEQLTKQKPVLGLNSTSGANILAEESDKVWRFAIFPDTQGRDDDNMKAYVCVDKNGNDVSVNGSPICEWLGVDFNGDGFYDAGTESQADSVKPGDWDEDGISYLVNVEDPLQPYIETDSAGAPIVVSPEDRKDFGPDWKILPVPLVEAVADKMIELDVDLVLATGDITEYRAESDYVQWMDKVASPLQNAGIDLFPVRGNHEIVNGRNWPSWFKNTQEWERQSVNNVYNDINPYEGKNQVDFDQGYALYQAYTGKIIKDHLDKGVITGYPGLEDLVYYFVKDNTLFIGLDFYFADIHNSTFKGTWLTLYKWLQEVITANAENVDHIVAFGHEPLSTKKRPQTYQVEQYEAYEATERALQAAADLAQVNYDAAVSNNVEQAELTRLSAILEEAISALEENQEPNVDGYDIGQLGYLLLQDDSAPGLANDVLTLFNDYQVTYISGHDHQYTRSLIHTDKKHKDTSNGFTQIVGGSASWKSYENLYGSQEEYETSLYIDNFVREDTVQSYVNSNGLKYAESTNGLAAGISFVVVEINGRQMKTTNYYAEHNLSEVDMNLGAHYDKDTNQWCHYEGDFMVKGSVETTKVCENIRWVAVDEASYTKDATKRVVEPNENYFLHSKAPTEEGYIGTEATIIDGYNMTYNTSYAANINRVEMLRELVTLSWFTDTSDVTLSDILYISGNQNQDGTKFNEFGSIDTTSPESLTYINRSGCEVLNATHVSRDGVLNKGRDLEASLSGDTSASDYQAGCGDSDSWNNRYNNDNLDFADAMAISIVAPQSKDLETLTVGRYDTEINQWVPAFSPECYIETGYSDHYSVHYRLAEQHPEGGYAINGCQQRYWGYSKSANVIWGFIHTDGKFAVIEK